MHADALPRLGLELALELALECALRKAIAQQEFVLYCQPKVELLDGQVVGLEARLLGADRRLALPHGHHPRHRPLLTPPWHCGRTMRSMSSCPTSAGPTWMALRGANGSSAAIRTPWR